MRLTRRRALQSLASLSAMPAAGAQELIGEPPGRIAPLADLVNVYEVQAMARRKLPESAIAKHPACAAPSNSSGFVPTPVSNREANEYAPLNAPFPKSTVPLPSLRVPSQRACAFRVGMSYPFQTSFL